MTANREPIFVQQPFHKIVNLTTEVTASRDPGAAVLPDLVEGGEDGALITSLGTIPIGTGTISTTLRLFLLPPASTQAVLMFELAITSGAAITYATLPNLDSTRKGLWIPPDHKVKASLSSAVTTGVLAIAQGGLY